jgi:hypothetical protein
MRQMREKSKYSANNHRLPQAVTKKGTAKAVPF